MPENQLYGLESGYADWMVAPRYETVFNSLAIENRQTAINMENKYYKTTGI